MNIIPILILIAALFWARSTMSYALKALDDKQKLKVIEAFSKPNRSSLFFIVPVMILFFFNIEKRMVDIRLATAVLLVSFLGYLFVISSGSLKRMKKLEVADSYQKAYIKSMAIRAIGLSAMFLTGFFL